jgi:hypothetical protein
MSTIRSIVHPSIACGAAHDRGRSLLAPSRFHDGHVNMAPRQLREMKRDQAASAISLRARSQRDERR